MSNRNPQGREDDPIESALAEFCAAFYDGNPPDPDAFLQAHEECGPALRRRLDEFLFLVEGMQDSAGAPVPEPAPQVSSGMMLDGFKILRELGRGGMGVVYEAEQVSLRRKVALKVLPAHLSFSDDAVKKFRREAEAGSRQTHSGMVAVYAVGEHEGIHYIAQELVEGGETLADHLRRMIDSGKVPLGYYRKAAKLMAMVAEALHHAHASGVIHRDVKPSNILITGEGNPKVTDFGLARVEDALSLSRTGQLSGTPNYMSPEQASSRPSDIDHRTDIFSLGVTFYELLTLALPFEGKTSLEVLKKIRYEDPPDPRRVSPRAPRDLAVICLKAMEKKPAHRYEDMGAFAEDLKRFLVGETILAQPAGPITRTMKRVQRNPALAASLCTAAAALVALVVLGVISYIQITKERDEKEKGRLTALSSSVLDEDPGLALLLAAEGAEDPPSLLSRNALMAALGDCHEEKTLYLGSVHSVALSPDGTRLVTASEDGTAYIRDIKTEEMLQTLRGHTRAIRTMSFSRDGRMIATASDDMTARVWDASTGEMLCEFRHEGPVHSAAFGPEGKRLVTASFDITARIWDLETRKEVTRFMGHAWAVNGASFHPSGKRVVTASDDRTLRIWALDTAREILRIQLPRPVKSAAYSADGWYIASVSEDKVARVWETERLEAGDLEPCASFDHPDLVSAAAISEDGTQVVTASRDGTARIWDLFSREPFFELKGHGGGITSAAFQRDGRRVVTASREDGTVRVWEMNGFFAPTADQPLAFSPGLDLIARVSEIQDDRITITLWKVADGSVHHRFSILRDHPGRHVRSLKFSPSGRRLAAAMNGPNTVLVWDTDSGRRHSELQVRSGDIIYMDFCPSDDQLAVACGQDDVCLFDVESGEIDGRLPHPKGAQKVLYSFCGQRLLTLASGKARLWDTRKYKPKPIPVESEGLIRDVGFGSAGELIYTRSPEGALGVNHGITGAYLHGLAVTEEAARARFGPGRNLLAAISTLGNVGVWDGAQPELLFKPSLQREKAYLAEFSPDGNRIAVASGYGNLRVYDLSTGSERFTVKHPSPVRFTGFTPDGQWLVTLDEKGIVRRWPVEGDMLAIAGSRFPRAFTLEERADHGLLDQDEEVPLSREADPLALNREAWAVARQPDNTPEAYHHARDKAERACGMDPANRIYPQTLGAALYRTGDNQEAVMKLEPYLGTGDPDPEGGCLVPIAFSAMAHHRLGRESRARALFDEFRVKMQDPWEGRFTHYRALFRELENRLDSADTGSKVPAGANTSWSETEERIGDYTFLSQKDRALWENLELSHNLALSEDRAFSGNRVDQVLESLVFRITDDHPEGDGALVLYDPLGKPGFQWIRALEDDSKHFTFTLSPDGDRFCFRQSGGADRSAFALMDRDLFLDHGKQAPSVIYRADHADLGLSCGHPRLPLVYCYDTNAKAAGRSLQQLVRLSAQGPEDQEPQLLAGGPDHTFKECSVSRDGRWICFRHWPGKSWSFNEEIWLARLSEDGKCIHAPRQITCNHHSERHLRFSRDGRWLYWIGYARGDSGSVFRMNLESGQTQRVYDARGTGVFLSSLAVAGSGSIALTIVKDSVHSVHILLDDGRTACIFSAIREGRPQCLGNLWFVAR